MVMLDANMILRYLLNDNAEMAEKAEEKSAYQSGEKTPYREWKKLLTIPEKKVLDFCSSFR